MGAEGTELAQVWNGIGQRSTEVKLQAVGSSHMVVEALQHVGSLHEVVVDISGVSYLLLKGNK